MRSVHHEREESTLLTDSQGPNRVHLASLRQHSGRVDPLECRAAVIPELRLLDLCECRRSLTSHALPLQVLPEHAEEDKDVYPSDGRRMMILIVLIDEVV